jgi:TolA-binding protein
MAKVSRPAAFVRAPVADERLFELWPQIERTQMRRASRRRVARRAAAGAAGLSALIAALVLARSPDADSMASSPTMAPTSIGDGKGDAPRQLSLADGSQLSLSADARAHVVTMRTDEVRVRLDEGRVECEVAPDRGRRFIVETGPFEVVVTGTRFTVAASADAELPASVVVRVERGSVEVRQPPDRLLATLGAGQLWASERDRNAVPLELPDAGGVSAAPSASSPEAAVPKEMSPKTTASRAASPSAPARPTPDVLLARASDARVAGKASEAAAALAELIRRYPRDERAGYAAFMLGRVRLDSLGNPKAAAEAFSFAIAHPGSGFFPEDAEARLVEALSKAGQRAECEQARARFLAKYPRAARAASIERECLGN